MGVIRQLSIGRSMDLKLLYPHREMLMSDEDIEWAYV